MASKKKVEAPVVSETEVPSTIGHGDFTVELSTLNAKALHYLANYGLNKSLQDAVAGRKGELSKELKEDGDFKYNDAEIATIIHDEQAKRFNAVIAGEVGSRGPGAPKATKLEAVMAAVAMERIKAGAAKLGKSLPKGEALQTLKAAYIAKNADSLKAEAETRMGSAATADVGDLADLLG